MCVEPPLLYQFELVLILRFKYSIDIGEDVETCVHRLLVAADWDADRASRGIIFIDEIDKLSRSSSAPRTKDVSGEGVQQALLKILEGTIVSVPDKDGGEMGRRKGPRALVKLRDAG